MIYPETLKEGDKVAIISPASVVNPVFIDSAAAYIGQNGFEPVVMPHAKGPACGSYAASVQDRLSDLLSAWQMPDVKAVLCSRGGYGAVHLLSHIPESLFSENPKWLVGFSDISALHAFSLRCGVVSIHGPMARDFNDRHEGGRAVMDILKNGTLSGYSFGHEESESMPSNRPGTASGKLTGGNLAVLDGLAGTPFDILNDTKEEDCVLFIEDIAEPIYKVERILYRLYLQGVFSRVKGLAVGQFTETSSDRNHLSMERMIEHFLENNGISGFPVAYGMPVGHFPHNMPVIEGADVILTVDNSRADMKFIRYLKI